MRDLAQPVPHDRGQAVRAGDEAGRIDAAPQRAAVDGGDIVVGEALAEAIGLAAAFVRDVDVDRAREPILGAELRRAVADEVEPGDAASWDEDDLAGGAAAITASCAFGASASGSSRPTTGFSVPAASAACTPAFTLAPLVGRHVRQRHPVDGGVLAP